MLSTYANAPAVGEGVGILLPRENTETPNEARTQAQLLSDRLGVSETVAALLLSLIRGEPHATRP